MKYQLNVNRERRMVDAESDTPLLWVLRDELGLTGTKYGCGVAQCGACTVHLGGSPVRSCVLPISHVGDREVVTIEGLEGSAAAAVQAEWRSLDVPQLVHWTVMFMAARLPRGPRPCHGPSGHEVGQVALPVVEEVAGQSVVLGVLVVDGLDPVLVEAVDAGVGVG